MVNRQPGQRDVSKCPEYIVYMKKKKKTGKKPEEQYRVDWSK
jgi:hypothetical protein